MAPAHAKIIVEQTFLSAGGGTFQFRYGRLESLRYSSNWHSTLDSRLRCQNRCRGRFTAIPISEIRCSTLDVECSMFSHRLQLSLLALDQRFHNVRIGQGGRVADLTHGVLSNLLQDAAHDFARARLGQAGRELNLVRHGNRPDFPAASATFGWLTSALSTSAVPMRWPETFTTSSMRPINQ